MKLQEFARRQTLDEILEIAHNVLQETISIALNEDAEVPDVPTDQIKSLQGIMTDAEKRYGAAKRALGLVGKLKPGPERQKHSKNIMINLNKLRAYNQRIHKALGQVLTKK